jgi:AcrR family transcriptional regulator
MRKNRPESQHRTQRRAPTQERSKVLVRALIDTTTRVLLRDGYLGLTTNAVAREAGVSVGSLYQYFPNKDALVRALIEELTHGMTEDFVSLGRALEGLGPEEAIAALVRATLHATRRDAPLYRTVLLELPRLGVVEGLERANQRLTDTLADWIISQHDQLAVPDPSLTAHVIVTSLDALTDHALVFRPELLESVRFERELRRLVAGCLGLDTAGRAKPRARARVTPAPRRR